MTLNFAVMAEEDEGRIRYSIELLEDRSPEDLIEKEREAVRKVMETITYPKENCGFEVERGSNALCALLELTCEDFSMEITLEYLLKEAFDAGRRIERKKLLCELSEKVE